MIVRDPPNTPFTIIPNHVIEDRRLPPDVFHLFCWIYSKPDDWDIIPKYIPGQFLPKNTKLGRNKVYAMLRTLMALGYLKRRFVYQKDHRNLKRRAVYVLYGTPPTHEPEVKAAKGKAKPEL